MVAVSVTMALLVNGSDVSKTYPYWLMFLVSLTIHMQVNGFDISFDVIAYQWLRYP